MNSDISNTGNLGLISVIMAVYNGENTVEQSINSILNQTYPHFEFLIIDDGSSDSTIKILKKCSKKDKRIKIFQHSTNLGLTKSLNLLINKIQGKFIARQDADDFSLATRFLMMVA